MCIRDSICPVQAVDGVSVGRERHVGLRSESVPRSKGLAARGTATADANGWFTAGEVTSSSTPPGTYVVTSSGGGQTLAAQLVVTWSGSGSSAGTAPRTAPGALTVGTPSSGSWRGGGSGSARTSRTCLL